MVSLDVANFGVGGRGSGGWICRYYPTGSTERVPGLKRELQQSL